jgi:hypothetical protein
MLNEGTEWHVERGGLETGILTGKKWRIEERNID